MKGDRPAPELLEVTPTAGQLRMEESVRHVTKKFIL